MCAYLAVSSAPSGGHNYVPRKTNWVGPALLGFTSHSLNPSFYKNICCTKIFINNVWNPNECTIVGITLQILWNFILFHHI